MFDVQKRHSAGAAQAPFRPFGPAVDDLQPVNDLDRLADRPGLPTAFNALRRETRPVGAAFAIRIPGRTSWSPVMTRMILSAVALVLAVPPAARPEDKPAPALDALRGTWVCITQSGNRPTKDVKLVVDKAGEYRLTGPGGDTSDLASQGGVEGKLRFTRTPGEIDLVGGKLTLPAIYKIEGERLTLFIGPGGARPTSFDKPEGALHVFIRETEKK